MLVRNAVGWAQMSETDDSKTAVEAVGELLVTWAPLQHEWRPARLCLGGDCWPGVEVEVAGSEMEGEGHAGRPLAEEVAVLAEVTGRMMMAEVVPARQAEGEAPAALWKMACVSLEGEEVFCQLEAAAL